MQRTSNSINNSRSGLRQNVFILDSPNTLILDEKKAGTLIYLDCSVNDLSIYLPPVEGSVGLFFNFIIKDLVNGKDINFYSFDNSNPRVAETKIKIKQHTTSDPVDNYTITIDTVGPPPRSWIGENFQIVSDGNFWFVTNFSFNETFEVLEETGIIVTSGNVDNYVISATENETEVGGESKLTYDDTQLNLTGDITLSDNLINTSSIVSFKDNIICSRGNIESTDLKTSYSFNDYWIQIGPDVDGESDNDESGTSVSISANGKILAVGSPNNGLGQVRVYNLVENVWTQLGADIDGEALDDKFGFSVALNNLGNILVVGAPENDETGNNAGSVRVFKWTGSIWNQLGDDIDGEAASDKSGTSVSINFKGDIIAIGAPENDGGGNNSGHVRIFSYDEDADSWGIVGAEIDGAAVDDKSGTVVSLNGIGNTVAIGSPNHDGDKGHVRVFKWNGTVWNQYGSDLDGTTASDGFGEVLQLSADGKVLAVGSSGINPGYIKVYRYSSSDWSQIGSSLVSEQSMSLALSATSRYLCVGNPITGNVKLYYWNNSSWDQVGGENGVIPFENLNDKFGASVSISGDGHIIAVGSPENNNSGTKRGSTRVFTRCDTITNVNCLNAKNTDITTGTIDSNYTINFLEIRDAVYTIDGTAGVAIEIGLSNAVNIGQTGFIILKIGIGVPVPPGITWKGSVGWITKHPTIADVANRINIYHYHIIEHDNGGKYVILDYRDSLQEVV